MFGVHGDEITFRGVQVAQLTPTAWPTLRDQAVAALYEWTDALEYTATQRDEYGEEEFQRGVDDGLQEGAVTAKPLLDAVRWVLDCETVTLKKSERAMLERILKRYDAVAC